MYLLDTDTLVFLLRGHAMVARNFDAHAHDPKALSVVTYGELLYGARKSARAVENEARVRRLWQLFPVVDVSLAVMETFASLRVGLERQGQRVDDFDLVVAATAIHLGYALVTNNTRHFRRVPGLILENWTSPGRGPQ